MVLAYQAIAHNGSQGQRGVVKRIWVVLSVLGTALLCGCGHPATREECEAIFQRSVQTELQAQNVTDPKIVHERTQAVRESGGQKLIDDCVGRRITDRALACVEKAATRDAVLECLQ